MNLARAIVIGCGAIVALSVGVLGLCAFFFYFPTHQIQSVTLLNLLIDVSWLPEGTALWEGPENTPKDLTYGADEGKVIFFRGSPSSELSSHTLLRFPNYFSASWRLSGIEAAEFYPGTLSGWRVPRGWSYMSPIADEFKFNCAESKLTPTSALVTRCTAIARYGEIISIFSAPISSDSIALTEAARILSRFDERMAKYGK